MTGVAINNRYAKRTSLISIDAINISTIRLRSGVLDRSNAQFLLDDVVIAEF
jgi:hypothetical protein